MSKVIEPGITIGNGYKLDEKIGESHLGDIYLATKDDGCMFRIEILSGSTTSDEESVTRFLQEVELMSQLQHENLLAAIEPGQDEDTYFLVSAHEPGMSLEDSIKSKNSIDEKSVLSYLISIAEVLKYTWDERKLLHRDLKPQNIYITEEGKAKLTGFGIAKSSEGQSMGLTGVGFTIGTPEYMSPEQIRADENLDFRSDLYGLGVVIYEALVGELPFVEDAPILLMQKHMDEVPESVKSRNPDVTDECSALVDKMLAKETEDRHQSWQELIDDAQAVLEGKAPTSKAVSSSSGTGGGDKPLSAFGKSPASVIGIIIAVIIVIVIVALLMKGG